jgi:hypothetical protein
MAGSDFFHQTIGSFGPLRIARMKKAAGEFEISE